MQRRLERSMQAAPLLTLQGNLGMTDVTVEPRTYRFAPLDRAGWILGLGAAQCLSVGVGIFLSGALLQAGAHPAVTVVPVALAALFAFGAWEGRRCYEWLPLVGSHLVRRVLRKDRWLAAVPLLGGNTTSALQSLPDFLAGLSIVDAGAVGWSPAVPTVGGVHDRRERTISGTLPVRGREFSLVERSEQERLVQQWGDVLGAFCSERRAVASVRASERSSSVSARGALCSNIASDADGSDALASYAEVLATAGPLDAGHEVLLTVTVDLRRVRGGNEDRPDDAGKAALLEELRLLTVRLDAAGLEPGPPLSPAQIAEAFRSRLDPEGFARSRPVKGSLADAAGLTSPRNCGPLVVQSEWSRVHIDGSLHRTYWIAEWPRLDVPPNWMETLLLHAAGTRTIAIHYEPVPPSKAQRRIDRDSTRLAADEEQRAKSGFRIGARHRRAQAAVLERESELVAGYSEFEFAGFITVSAIDDDELDRACAEYEQAAAQVGLELRSLDARHDTALACALPIGRGLARRRWS